MSCLLSRACRARFLRVAHKSRCLDVCALIPTEASGAQLHTRPNRSSSGAAYGLTTARESRFSQGCNQLCLKTMAADSDTTGISYLCVGLSCGDVTVHLLIQELQSIFVAASVPVVGPTYRPASDSTDSK